MNEVIQYIGKYRIELLEYDFADIRSAALYNTTRLVLMDKFIPQMIEDKIKPILRDEYRAEYYELHRRFINLQKKKNNTDAF
jgi:hypothetical protein